MTKPVAVFRSGVIGDPIHTVRFDENSHLVLFPSFSRYPVYHLMGDIRYQPHGQRRHLVSRCYRPGYMAGCRLVTMLVVSRGRVGLVTPTPNGYLPALFGVPFHVYIDTTGGVGFCPFDRAVAVDPRFSLRRRTRLGVLVPQHQSS
jgi:hypothetical protein